MNPFAHSISERVFSENNLRCFFRTLFRVFFRVRVVGLEHFAAAGPRVLVISNHQSFLDAALIATFIPEKVTFAINTHIAAIWWIKPFLRLVDAFALNPGNPLAAKELIDLLKTNHKCVIFPEGRITITGSLMKVYEGAGMMADRSGAVILPIRIQGAEYSYFSRLKGKVRRRLFPTITMTIMPARPFELPAEVKGRARRQLAGVQLYDLMSQMIFDTSDYNHTVYEALLRARGVQGGGHVIAEDIDRKPITYNQVILRSTVLGRLIVREIGTQHNIGILLPTSIGGMLTFFALQSQNKVPAMLNFSAGAGQMILACKMAEVTTLLTSERFIEKADLKETVEKLVAAGLRVLYLEHLRPKVRLADKIAGLEAMFGLVPSTHHAAPIDNAVILFTSGSEGTPKGVVLSHRAIVANCMQLAARVDFGPADSVFNCLPMFHAFGLTAGTLLPLFFGVRAFYYPSPLHYRIVPELVYDTNSTMFFGTDTFLAGYAKQAHPYDFHMVRFIFAGAEKLKEETRRIYAEKFGVRIFEGYGVTETAPVLSMNTPMQPKAGTVGRLLPDITYHLKTIEGITQGQELWVKGPNLMTGYLHANQPGVIEKVPEEGYNTGDIVTIDEMGYVTIQGRVKRFAKIAGEMVSLAAVESAASRLWPKNQHAAVSLPDAKKGEKIILLTDYKEATRDALIKQFQQDHLSELAIPRSILVVDAIPLLGSGKIDHPQAKAIAEKHEEPEEDHEQEHT